MNDEISTNYKKWLNENYIKIDRRLKIRKSSFGGVGVFAESAIPADEILVSIPKNSILSVKTCGIANLLDEYQIDGINGLTLAYMFEKGQKEQSPWYAYLETFIGDSIPILPRWWPQEQKNLLKGTEIEHMGGLDELENQEIYEQIVKPFIEEHEDFFPLEEHKTYEGYCSSLVCVCSRAFEVDDFLGISLVPSADLFNHSDEENVNFQTNFDVCVACGLFNSCDHNVFGEEEEEREVPELIEEDDDEDDDQDQNDSDDDEKDDLDVQLIKNEYQILENDEQMSDIDEQTEIEPLGEYDENDLCDIVSIRDISADSEVFNTYGDHSNAILLAKYGFAIWDNCHETVNLAVEIMAYAKSHDMKSRIKWFSANFYRCIYGIKENHYDRLENDQASSIPPPGTINWSDTLDISSDGTSAPGLTILLEILSMSSKEFLECQKKVKRGSYDFLHTRNKSDLLSHIIHARLHRYKDGNLTSTDYKSSVRTGPAKLADIVKGTEKLVLERALRNDTTRKWKKRKNWH